MQKPEFIDLLKQAVREERKQPDLEVDESSTFAALGLDSLDLMNLLVRMEELTGLKFDDIEVLEEDTLAGFFDKVSQAGTDNG